MAIKNISNQLTEEQYKFMQTREFNTQLSYLDLVKMGKFFAMVLTILSRLLILMIALIGVVVVASLSSGIFSNNISVFWLIFSVGILLLIIAAISYLYEFFKNGKLH